MTPDSKNWDQLQALFHLAEQSPDEDLEELLARATDDPELRARARGLIEAGRRADLNAPLAGAPALPEKIGPYTLLRHLGTGGIGAVYLVERRVGGAVQRAALKMLARSAGGAFFAERFAREQYILASLQHENITRMLDAGVSATGQPYLVMEYVNGVHLDRYCDERSLGVPARLTLFLEVCKAISYAHQNLVVHLDLKPSNILVTSDSGTVKVLDFGTSKLIQPDSLLTTTVMATPAYASPEQLLNEPVTTVCDVYALGAILFELLSGRRPNQDSSVALLIERSLKEFPPEPITENLTESAAEHRGLTQTRLRSLLAGDLATIVSKCLNPRPKDRYATVDALIDDVQRYLEGRPIAARPQTTTYRLGKFVRRNRIPVVLGLVATLALAGSLGYAAWRQHQAVVAGRRAIAMQTFLVKLFNLANDNRTGKPATTVSELLDIGMKATPDMIADAGDRRVAQLALIESIVSDDGFVKGEAYLLTLIDDARKAGDLTIEAEAESDMGEIESSLGHSKQADEWLARALALTDAPDLDHEDRLHIRASYAYNREQEGQGDDRTLKMLQDAVVDARRYHLSNETIAVHQDKLGLVLANRGRSAEADPLFLNSLAMYQKMPHRTCDEGLILRYLGRDRALLDDYQGALPYYQQSYAKLKQCSGDDTLKTLGAETQLAATLERLGRSAEMMPQMEAALPLWRKVSGPRSTKLGPAMLFLAHGYAAAGEYDKATSMAAELRSILHESNKDRTATTGQCEEVWAVALAGEHHYPEALNHAQKAVIAFPEHPSPSETTALKRAEQTLTKIQAENAAAAPK